MRTVRWLTSLFDETSFEFLSRPARLLVVLLVVAAVAFCVVVVALDLVEGTATSTESLVVVIAGVPLFIAVTVVACVDYVIQQLRR